MVFRALGFALATLLALGCSGGDPAPIAPVSTTVEGFCTTACDRVIQCEVTQDRDTCFNQCRNTHAVSLPKLRADVIAQGQTCMKSRDCKTALGTGFRETCLLEAEALVAPSQSGIALCERWSQALTNCSLPADKPQCLEHTKRYSDNALQSAIVCTIKACTQIDPCMAAFLGP